MRFSTTCDREQVPDSGTRWVRVWTSIRTGGFREGLGGSGRVLNSEEKVFNGTGEVLDSSEKVLGAVASMVIVVVGGLDENGGAGG